MVHYPNFPDVDKLTCCICRIPISTSPTIEYMSDSLSEEDSVPQFMKQVWKCQGIKFDFPKGRSPCIEWPWGEQVELSMAWNVHSHGGILAVYALNCLKTTKECQQCKNCDVQGSGRLSSIQSCISHGISETTPYKYLSTSRLIEVLQQKDHQIDALKLGHLNSN